MNDKEKLLNHLDHEHFCTQSLLVTFSGSLCRKKMRNCEVKVPGSLRSYLIFVCHFVFCISLLRLFHVSGGCQLLCYERSNYVMLNMTINL